MQRLSNNKWEDWKDEHLDLIFFFLRKEDIYIKKEHSTSPLLQPRPWHKEKLQGDPSEPCSSSSPPLFRSAVKQKRTVRPAVKHEQTWSLELRLLRRKTSTLDEAARATIPELQPRRIWVVERESAIQPAEKEKQRV